MRYCPVASSEQRLHILMQTQCMCMHMRYITQRAWDVAHVYFGRLLAKLRFLHHLGWPFSSMLCGLLCISVTAVPPLVLLAVADNACKQITEGSPWNAQVHRHHPPLVYGRSMSEDPEHSEGAAICKAERGPQGRPVYAAITYQ